MMDHEDDEAIYPFEKFFTDAVNNVKEEIMDRKHKSLMHSHS